MKKLVILFVLCLGAAWVLQGQSVTVTAPNGGERWTLGSTQTITWTHAAVSGNVRINLVNAAGGVAGTIANVPVTDDRYSWSVGTLTSGAAPAGEYMIGLYVRSADIEDRSNAVFTIVGEEEPPPPTPTITVSSPNGGESWELGSSHSITWSRANLSGTVNVELLRDGAVLGTIASGLAATATSHPWTVGEYTGGRATARGGYRVRVRHSLGRPSDDSNRDFTITAEGGDEPPPPAGGTDLTISNVYLEQRSSGKGIRLRVTDLGGDFNGWVVFSTFTGKMGLGNALKERRRLELRRGVPAWVNLANVNGSYFNNECSLNYTIKVNPDREVVETNYDNNRVVQRLFWSSTHDGRVFPIQRIGRNYTHVNDGATVTIRRADVESAASDHVRIRFEVTVRNCGNSAIESGTVSISQSWIYTQGRGGRELEGGGPVDDFTVSGMEPGHFRIITRTITLAKQDSTLWVNFDCGESGTLNNNNRFNCRLDFEGF
ncbi:MAG: hypothetical protein JXO51_09715 [Candidatus Aminicenantes bacterium]|nr:hypothetical protein [Candidatus Aminicenantes bacterium]